MKLPTELIAEGKAEYFATMTDDNKERRDETITPFGMAMKIAGYRPITTIGGCLVMRDCKVCRVGYSSYSTKYEKDGATVWACPFCTELTEQ